VRDGVNSNDLHTASSPQEDLPNGLGLQSARRWLEILPRYAPKNPLGLMFPTRTGSRRQKGKHLHRSVWRDGKSTKVDMFQIYLQNVAGQLKPRKFEQPGRPSVTRSRPACPDFRGF
jgi:hypothetical protein